MGCTSSSCISTDSACFSSQKPTHVSAVSIPPATVHTPTMKTHTLHNSTHSNSIKKKSPEQLKSSIRSDSSRRRTFTLSKDRLAHLQHNDVHTGIGSLRKASTHKRPSHSHGHIHRADSAVSVNANGLISSQVTQTQIQVTDQNGTAVSPIQYQRRQSAIKKSHRKNLSSTELIPNTDNASRPTTGTKPIMNRIPTIDAHTHTGLTADGTQSVNPRRRSGRNTLNGDGLKSIKRRNSNNGMMSKLALRFPTIRTSFLSVHEAFGKYILERSTKYAKLGAGQMLRPVEMKITKNNLGDVLSHIVHKKFSGTEIAQLFKLSDLDDSKCIEFREFLIAIAIGYYLRVPVYELSTSEAEIAKGFLYVQDAFKQMDKDGSNSVDITELKTALFSASNTKQSTAVLEARFKELDFNSDGDIELPEFLYGVVSWVGLLDEDEEH